MTAAQWRHFGANPAPSVFILLITHSISCCRLFVNIQKQIHNEEESAVSSGGAPGEGLSMAMRVGATLDVPRQGR